MCVTVAASCQRWTGHDHCLTTRPHSSPSHRSRSPPYAISIHISFLSFCWLVCGGDPSTPSRCPCPLRPSLRHRPPICLPPPLFACVCVYLFFVCFCLHAFLLLPRPLTSHSPLVSPPFSLSLSLSLRLFCLFCLFSLLFSFLSHILVYLTSPLPGARRRQSGVHAAVEGGGRVVNGLHA